MDHYKVAFLAFANVFLGAIAPWLTEAVQFLVSVGQLSVAIVTVWYVITKIKDRKNRKP